MWIAVIATAAFLISPSLAFGGTLRIEFAGSILSVAGGSSSGAWDDPDAVIAIGGSIQPGTRFSGYLILDPDASPSIVNAEGSVYQPEQSIYDFAWPESVLHTEVGSYVTDASYPNAEAPTGGFRLYVIDNELYTEGADPSRLVTWGYTAGMPETPGAPFVMTEIQLDLWGGTPGLPLHSTSLANFPWSLESFPYGGMLWTFNDADSGFVIVNGQLDQLSAVQVPEPSIAALLAIGAAGLCALGFRRARS